MNRVICVNGHFYDGDKYASCPHCAEGTPAITPDHFAVAKGAADNNQEKAEAKEAKKEKKGLFGKKKEKEEPVFTAPDDGKTERLSPSEAKQSLVEEAPVKQVDDPAVNPYVQPIIQPAPVNPVSAQQGPAGNAPTPGVQQPVAPQPVMPQPTPAPAPVKPESSKPAGSLQSALVQAANARQKPSDEGKTVGYFSTGSTEPPVGYLICVKGEDYGKGFLLKSGNNSIGRSQSMDVVLMDPKVSRDKQAYVMYEPRKREFYVRPGESSGLCYYNDEMIVAPTKIGQFDKIMLGDTVLMLIPVCCDQFSWDEVD